MDAEPDRPNIIFLFPDQWRGDCLGSLGHPAVETPWLDSLAGEGVSFTNAYSPAPSCVPARACLITGQTPSSTGRPGMEEGIPWRYPTTLMRRLRDGGYQTMLAGKTHFYPQMTTCGFEVMRQYEAKVVGDAPECDYHTWLARETGGRIEDTGSQVNRNSWIVHPWMHEERLHPSTWTMDAALGLLARRDPLRPFFLQIGFNRPHPPFDPPWHVLEAWRDREVPDPATGEWSEAWRNVRHLGLPAPTSRQIQQARQAYCAQLNHIDHQVGRLIHRLKEAGLFANTWMLFSSDHGEMLGDHHRFGKQVPLEGSAKVPLFIRPARGTPFAPGAPSDVPCTLCDLMPTFLDIAGLAVPDCVEGQSLVPALSGQPVRNREFIHGEHAGAEGWQFVTDGREKYFWESRSGREWFFDLRQDPRECVDLSGDPGSRDRVDLWRRRLIDILAARAQDGLSDGEKLIAGKVLPRTRPELKAL